MISSYEDFKDMVAEEILTFMPEKYRDMEVKIVEVEKVNQKLDGLNIVSKDNGIRISPTIYLNSMYKEYEQSGDLSAVIEMAAEMMTKGIEHSNDIQKEIDFDNAKDNITFMLINTEQNKEMLKDMPHREFQDLSIVYRWVVKIDEKEGVHSSPIHNSLAERFGYSEEQLFKFAVENTKRIFPPTVRNMNDIMREIFMKDGMPAEIAEMMISDIPEDRQMWVIGNEQGINGAVSMLYEDKLHELSERLDSDLYIMPSSIHETIAISATSMDPEELAMMVQEVNMNEVSLGERMSNQVYHYDKDLRTLRLATDTPNKRLDGIVADMQMIYSADTKSR